MDKDTWRISVSMPNRFTATSFNETLVSAIPESVRSKVYNRFMDVLPNPRTRVPLEPIPGEPGSEYINANYIRSYDGKNEKAYIAAMGPLPATLNNFWRMIWQDKIEIIIMSTELEEKGKIKCERYFPSLGETMTYGAITITATSVVQCPGYLKSQLAVKKDSTTRTVWHYWFNTWPDHGVPMKDDKPYAGNILDMLIEIHAHQKQLSSTAPILLHCSAGVGRSGAIIAMDHSMNLLKTVGQVDLLGLIKELRTDRVSMVQLPNQYELVHEACLEFAKNNGKQIELYDPTPPRPTTGPPPPVPTRPRETLGDPRGPPPTSASAPPPRGPTPAVTPAPVAPTSTPAVTAPTAGAAPLAARGPAPVVPPSVSAPVAKATPSAPPSVAAPAVPQAVSAPVAKAPSSNTAPVIPQAVPAHVVKATPTPVLQAPAAQVAKAVSGSSAQAAVTPKPTPAPAAKVVQMSEV